MEQQMIHCFYFLIGQMIHCFSTALTHATPANYKLSPLDEIIIGKNPTPSCCPNKGHLVKDLSTPNIPPRE